MPCCFKQSIISIIAAQRSRCLGNVHDELGYFCATGSNTNRSLVDEYSDPDHRPQRPKTELLAGVSFLLLQC